MKNISTYILVSTFILASCGGGGGGGSAPPAPIYPSISFQTNLSVDGGKEITISPTINDPQSRILTRTWEIGEGGKAFNFNYTNTSVTFTAPKNQTDHTLSIKLSYTYTIDGTPTSSGSGSATGQFTIKAVIPEIPSTFNGNGLSQSADFTWNVSDGAASYYLYYSSDNSITSASTYVEIEGEDRSEVFMAYIPNDITQYWAISAINSAGESGLSTSIAITTKSPEAEFTNQPNTGNFNLVKMDKWGNELNSSATSWSCIKDKVTGLMWEVKKDTNRTFGDDGLRDLDDKFSYYDSTNVVNGANDFGDKNTDGTDCLFAIDGSNYNCNTEDFFISLNSQPAGENFCGRTDWRLPTLTEIIQLVDFNEFYPKLSVSYFTGTNNINGAYETYWTANQEEDGDVPTEQFIVTFDSSSISDSRSKTQEYHVLSVTGSDLEANEPVNFSVECFEWDDPSQYWSYEYYITDAKELAASKSNEAGEDWRVSTIKELIHFVDDLPTESNILTSSQTPNGQMYDYYSVEVVGESDEYYVKKGQIGIGASLRGTYNICLSKY